MPFFDVLKQNMNMLGGKIAENAGFIRNAVSKLDGVLSKSPLANVYKQLKQTAIGQKISDVARRADRALEITERVAPRVAKQTSRMLVESAPYLERGAKAIDRLRSLRR